MRRSSAVGVAADPAGDARKPGPWATESVVVVGTHHRPCCTGRGCARPSPNAPGTVCAVERPGPMQLWQMDIVGGLRLGLGVMGSCGKRRWSRRSMTTPGYGGSPRWWSGRPPGCVLALAEALVRFGCRRRSSLTMASSSLIGSASTGPATVRCCSTRLPNDNGTTHRLTAPASPLREREGGGLRRHSARLPRPGRAVHLGGGGQAAVDTWVRHETPTGRTRRSMRRCRSPLPSGSTARRARDLSASRLRCSGVQREGFVDHGEAPRRRRRTEPWTAGR